MLNRLLTLLLAAAILAVPTTLRASEKIPVVATFSILGDLLGRIGGERVAVTTLVGPNADAHVYQPTPSDVRAVTKARLIVVNGLGFEGWMARLTGAANFKGEVVVASRGIKTLHMSAEGHAGEHGSEHEGGHGADDEIDPHAWHDPTKVITYVDNIAAALTRLDPAGADYFKANAVRYTRQLRELDIWAGAQFARIPAAKRSVITSHDAFGYLGARYQIRFVAPQGLSTDSQASAKDVAKLIRQIKRDGTKAIFVENMATPRLIEQISREAGATVGPALYSDALSDASGPAPTYLAMMRYNVEQLVEGLKRN